MSTDQHSRKPDDAVETDGGAHDHEQLVRANIAWMLGLAERMLRDRALAEDVVQEAFIKAFRGLADFEGRASIKTWLRRITVNTTVSKLRQLDRLREQSIDEHMPEFDRFDCRVEAPWSGLAPVDDVMENDDLRRSVLDAIDELPDGYRVVLNLRDIEGYSTAEVAAMLDLSTSNVKVRLHRARSALKSLLEPVLREEVE